MIEPWVRMLYPPDRWTNPVVRLYHGTVEEDARTIAEEGVEIARGRVERDFGPGFYTSTLQRQARTWAFERADKGPGHVPAVVAFDLDRDALSELEVLAFVRGDFHADDFWSFVVHCRAGAVDHARKTRLNRRYDVVSGPVAAAWKQRLAFDGADQVSFHTPLAESVLNLSPRAIAWTSSL